MENKSADAQGTGGPHAQQAGGPPAVAMQPLQQPQGVQPPHQQAGMAVAMYPQPQAGGPGPIGPPQPMQQPQGGQPPHQQAAVAVAMYPQPQAAFPQHGYGFVQQPYYHQQVYSPSPNAPAASSAQGPAPKPWAFAPGDATVSSTSSNGRRKRPRKPEFEAASATCALCFEEKAPLFAFTPCGHYPYCNDCIFRSSRGSIIRCSSCRKIVDDKVPANKVRPKQP